jgi:hypothetical protein
LDYGVKSTPFAHFAQTAKAEVIAINHANGCADGHYIDSFYKSAIIAKI